VIDDPKPLEQHCKELLLNHARRIKDEVCMNPGLLQPDPEVSIQDIRGGYNIVLKRLPTRAEIWEATDLVTFDPDPEGKYHLVGTGSTVTEAVTDLLQQMAEVA
jgi:hypothetical protein